MSCQLMLVRSTVCVCVCVSHVWVVIQTDMFVWLMSVYVGATLTDVFSCPLFMFSVSHKHTHMYTNFSHLPFTCRGVPYFTLFEGCHPKHPVPSRITAG